MDKVKTTTVCDAREFFMKELKDVMQKQRVKAKSDSVEYLVNLLLRYMESDTFFAKNSEGKLENNVLVALYAEYLQGNTEQKIANLRRLGDVCLMVTGFFPDSLKRKVVDLDYYFGMGGTAYGELANLNFSAMARTLYKELSDKFKPFAEVLGEMSERSGLQSNSDLLRLYEKWLMTGSDRLRGLLSEHGIAAPVKLEVKTKH